MIRTGILKEDDRVELIYGWIVDKMPQNSPHAAAVSRLQLGLPPVLGGEWVLRSQLPVTFVDSEPEPDAVIARGPVNRYDRRHPRGRDITAVIEVADTSLEDDRTVKGPLYARERIPTYWIVNVVDRQIEVYSQPRAGKSPAYRHQQTYRPGEAVPLVLAGAPAGAIPVDDLLPTRAGP
jgi:Uma2 family endonuclease